ncbi:hypothetical protein KDL45_04595, partial [bacterium]|nr:hypothetical protein [bacterium]
ASSICFMNCSFEFIAGLAIFSLLFAFSIAPKASTLSMMFFVVPEGIAAFPFAVKLFGILFFVLLIMAGLTSSVSLVEALIAAVLDKFPHAGRKRVVALVAAIGMTGSIAFAWPMVIDKGLASDGTLGLSLLDMFDHWVFQYGLMICGLLECVLVGWVYDVDKVLAHINETSSIKLGGKFKVLIRYIVPAIIIFVIGWNLITQELMQGLYGTSFELSGANWLPWLVFAGWLGFALGGAFLLTRLTDTNSEGAA